MKQTIRIWTEAEIKRLILTNDDMIKGSLKKLYSYQTQSEQRRQETQLANGVGFNAYDAPILSSITKWYINRGYLSDKQIAVARKRLVKYTRQLTRIANNEL